MQGASTIPQQYVKISLAAENDRTMFQKLREAALAYQFTRRWSKERILRNYLNTIYFGNGAYGIESAARTYFAYNHDKCEPECAQVLYPHEAALLAGIVASPSAYDPTQHPVAARKRRDLVLLRMFEQGYIPRDVYESGKAEDVPTQYDLIFPKEDTEVPVLHLLGQAAGRRPARRRPAGRAARVRRRPAGQDDDRLQAPDRRRRRRSRTGCPTRPGRRPRSSRSPTRTAWSAPWSAATTSGTPPAVQPRDAGAAPARLGVQAVRARRRALERGISPNSTWASKKLTYILKGGERFTVNNYDDAYAGIADARPRDDLLRQRRVRAGGEADRHEEVVSKLAREAGIRTKVSTNLASALGGLSQGVTPLDMAHAYETFATGGLLIDRHLSPGQSDKKLPVPGPVGIERIDQGDGQEGQGRRDSTTAGAWSTSASARA